MGCDGSADHSQDFDDQEASLRRWAENHIAKNSELTIIRIDGGGTAGYLNVLRRLVDSRESRVGTIVVTSLDQVSRGPEVHEFVWVVKANGILLVVLDDAENQRL